MAKRRRRWTPANPTNTLWAFATAVTEEGVGDEKPGDGQRHRGDELEEAGTGVGGVGETRGDLDPGPSSEEVAELDDHKAQKEEIHQGQGGGHLGDPERGRSGLEASNPLQPRARRNADEVTAGKPGQDGYDHQVRGECLQVDPYEVSDNRGKHLVRRDEERSENHKRDEGEERPAEGSSRHDSVRPLGMCLFRPHPSFLGCISRALPNAERSPAPATASTTSKIPDRLIQARPALRAGSANAVHAARKVPKRRRSEPRHSRAAPQRSPTPIHDHASRLRGDSPL